MGWFLNKATSEVKNFVKGLILNGIRNEKLGDYTGDFEKIADIFNGEHKQTTVMRLKDIEHY